MRFLAIINNAARSHIENLRALWIISSSQATLPRDGQSILERRMMEESSGPVLSVWAHTRAKALGPMQYVLIYGCFA